MKINHLSATLLDSSETKFHVVATAHVIKGDEARVLDKLQAACSKVLEKFEAEFAATPAGIVAEALKSRSENAYACLLAAGGAFKLAATIEGQTLDQVRTAVRTQTSNVPTAPASGKAAAEKLLVYYAAEIAKREPDAVAAEIVSAIDEALVAVGEAGL